jgi:hypothetical protein
MSHSLIHGIKLSRTLIWLKPNVIILIDNGSSESEHTYTQNFVLSSVLNDEDYSIKQFDGGNRAERNIPTENHRCITYNKSDKTAFFITAVEGHSKDETLKASELHIENITAKENQIEITFADETTRIIEIKGV